MYANRELRITTTAKATGTSLNKRFNEQNNGCVLTTPVCKRALFLAQMHAKHQIMNICPAKLPVFKLMLIMESSRSVSAYIRVCGTMQTNYQTLYI